MQSDWDYVMGQMLSFVDDTNADLDMAYDFVCEQLEIDSFVDNLDAWDEFYEYWKNAFVGDNKWGRTCAHYLMPTVCPLCVIREGHLFVIRDTQSP